jgi:methylisocitrate lyase
MLYSQTPAAEKRRLLRERLAAGSCCVSRRVQPAVGPAHRAKGFEGVYISGAVLSADLGLPDIGLTTLTEVAGRGQQIARMTELPAIIDADTGFGEPMNVARTIQTLEDAGLAGTHIEDQVNPKRCGHLDGKQVVDETPRSSASAPPSTPAATRTSSSWRAPTSAPWRAGRRDRPRQGARRCRGRRDLPRGDARPRGVRGRGAAVDVPILANMTEFGKSELFASTSCGMPACRSSSGRCRCCGSRWARPAARWIR